MEIFDGLSRLIDKVLLAETGEDSGIWDEEFQKHFKDHVTWARKTLKRKDRIVWYLRLVRVGFVCHVIEHYTTEHTHAANQNRLQNVEETPTQEPEHLGMIKVRDILMADYLKRFGVDLSKDRIPERLAGMWRGFDKNDLKHSMDTMPQVPKMEALRWTVQTPEQLRTQLRTFEQEWQQEQREDASLIQGPQDKTIMDFPDGRRWVHLPRGGCQQEARAGGHCGNGSDRGDGTTICSLREPNKKKGRKGQWKVLCTFILDPKGVFGEMKARFNQKPDKELHPHIMALLKNPMIKGIRGSGYLPEKNFTFTDLTPEQRREVLSANLIPVIQREGEVPRMQDECGKQDGGHEFLVRPDDQSTHICVKCGAIGRGNEE